MQTTLDSKKGYNDGIECCADDFAELIQVKITIKKELEQVVGHELISPIIIEDEDECPCPDTCPVIQGIADPDEECHHCSLISLTMGATPHYLRK